MGFRIPNITAFNYSSPQEMYADYKNRKIRDLHAHQSKAIDSYMREGFSASDVSLELPTGSGKTLVGLLLGEFRRRKNHEKVLYLCTNKLLVNQVVKQAGEYGIQATPFIGSKANYPASAVDAYRSGRTIAVAHYNALFNCSPFFMDPDMIIFDDAHAAEGFVAANWTVRISHETHRELYLGVCDAIKPLLGDGAYHRLIEDGYTSATQDWIELVPGGSLGDIAEDVRRRIDSHVASVQDDIRFSWSTVGRSLGSCNIYASSAEICVRPFIPPTQTFAPFRDATQRLYMSATPGRSGELERSFGIQEITTLPMLEDWRGRTTGRRFFVFPLSSFGAMGKDSLLISMLEKAGRALVMVASTRERDRLKDMVSANTSRSVFSADDLENDKTVFLASEDGVAIVANRVDGIDFPDDECRVEVLFDMSEMVDIQERFFVSVAAVRPLYAERMRNRMTQAFGRCARSQNDRAVVCVLDESAANRTVSASDLAFLNPELQAELVFGYENAVNLDSLPDYLGLIDDFLGNTAEWAPAEEAIISIRDERAKRQDDGVFLVAEKLKESSCHEVLASYAMWKGDDETVLQEAESAFAILDGFDDLAGYAAYWGYIAACSAHGLYESTGDESLSELATEWLHKARGMTLCSQWLVGLRGIELGRSVEPESLDVVIAIEERIGKRIGRGAGKGQLISDLQNLMQRIEREQGEEFEAAHCELGEWLGYYATNPRGSAEPDPLWVRGDSLCIVFEDKIYKGDKKEVSVRHARQAAGHGNWVRKRAHEGSIPISSSAEVVTVFLTNAETIDPNAKLQVGGIYYLPLEDFRRWAASAIGALSKSIESFVGVGGLVWREALCANLKAASATSRDFIALVKSRPLEKL